MKLNSLIKYNSAKILSILGYLLSSSIIYLQFIALPQAANIDKQTGCHFDADFPSCAANNVEIIAIMTYGIIILISFIALIALGGEFLYKKYKVKDSSVKKYPIFWVIVFWIGIILQIALFLLIFYFIFFVK